MRTHTHACSAAHRWFFEVLSELSKEDLALMIQFITGTSKVPLEGFKALQGIGGPQKFQIHKVRRCLDERYAGVCANACACMSVHLGLALLLLPGTGPPCSCCSCCCCAL